MINQVINAFLVSAVAANPVHATNAVTGSVATSAGYVDLADLGTVGLDAASNYLGVFSCDANQSSATFGTEARVLVGGSSIHTVSPNSNDHRTAAEYRSAAGIFFIQNPGAATTTTVKLQGSQSGGGTATFRNRRLTILKMGPNDVLAESLAAQALTDTTANKTATTVASLSFTPPSSGNYIIIVSFMPRLDTTTNVYFGFQLQDGGGSTTELGLRMEDGTQEPVVMIWPRTALSGAQTVNLKIRQIGTGTTTIGCAEVRMVAIREDRFASITKTRLGADSNSTTATYVSALSQIFTPAAADYLTLATWHQEGDVAYGQFVDDGTVLNEEITAGNFEPANAGGRPGFAHQLAAYTATSRTHDIQRKASADAAIINDTAQIVSFNLTGLS